LEVKTHIFKFIFDRPYRIKGTLQKMYWRKMIVSALVSPMV
jgi:hypothetical protein